MQSNIKIKGTIAGLFVGHFWIFSDNFLIVLMTFKSDTYIMLLIYIILFYRPNRWTRFVVAVADIVYTYLHVMYNNIVIIVVFSKRTSTYRAFRKRNLNLVRRA